MFFPVFRHGRLQGRLHGLEARVAQNGPPLRPALSPAFKSQAAEGFAKFHFQSRGMHIAHPVDQNLRLVAQGLPHLCVPVPQTTHGKGTGEIEVAVAVRIPDIRTLGSLPRKPESSLREKSHSGFPRRAAVPANRIDSGPGISVTISGSIGPDLTSTSSSSPLKKYSLRHTVSPDFCLPLESRRGKRVSPTPHSH